MFDGLAASGCEGAALGVAVCEGGGAGGGAEAAMVVVDVVYG